LNYLTLYFQNFIKNKDIRLFKNKKSYFLLFRILRKFFNQDLIVDIYNFKVFASYKKNKTSHALLKKCDFDDKTELLLIENISKKNNIFLIDCGSNYGFYSLFTAKHKFQNKVVAVEASKRTTQLLQNNIILNNLNNISVYNNALSDTDNQKVIFNESFNDWESSLSHQDFKLSNQENVDTKKIDTIIEENKPSTDQILVIKMDIEGNEFKALRGAYMTIETYEPIIIIEFSRFIFNEEKSKEFLSYFLKKFDYKIYDIKNMNISENKIFESISSLDEQHDTIGNYYLVKNNSLKLNFLKNYD
jgi:FkbM family methyltransferase|tara:strand:+ start:206 stop:1114 length:909 start_codon:yes stop_codon:yes gene_type:complete